MTKIIDDEGREFELSKEMRQAEKGDWFLSPFGVRDWSDHYPSGEKYVILRLIPKRHVFGGVVFEETCEVRQATREWALIGGQAAFAHVSTTGDYPILRPVKVIS